MYTNKRLRFLFIFVTFLVLVFSFSSHHVFASTIVIDDILEDTIWTVNNSPYVVNDSVVVHSGVILTIEPGVIVKMHPSLGRLTIWGSFLVKGATENHVSFTSLWDDTIGGDTNGDGNKTIPIVSLSNSKGLWDSIYFNNAEKVSLENFDVSFSRRGVYFWLTDAFISGMRGRNNWYDLNIRENSEVLLSGADLYGSLFESVYLVDSVFVGDHIVVDSTKNFVGFITFNSDLFLADSVIQNLPGRTQGIGAEGPGTINLERVIFKNNPQGLVGFEGIILNVKDCIFDNSAIVTWGGAVSNINNSQIKNNIYAAILDYGNSTFNIDKSQIVNNFYGIYLLRDDRVPHSIYNISNTPIVGNKVYGVYNKALYPIHLENIWWGDASGPHNEISNPEGLGNDVLGNVFFDPWCKNETCETLPSGFSNVLFLPGLEASRLYVQRESESEDQLWEPNGNSDVEALYLNTDGTTKNPNVYTRDIIKETNSPVSLGFVGQNIYKSFSNMMDGLVSDKKITEWKSYAYDWRQGVQDVVDNGTKYKDGNVSLVSTLQSLINSSKNKKVTIVAHSNGGLVAKALLRKLQDDKVAGRNSLIDSIDVLILVAVPEIGTASAVPAILHGYDQRILSGWLMDEIHARELGRNMLGAFGLLPSKEYINHVSASPATFIDTAIPSNVTTKLVQAFGSAINSYLEYKNFLFGGEGRTSPAISQINLPISLSQSLFSKAESLHDSIDAFVPPEGLRVIEVAGWGLDTIASFEYYPRIDDNSSYVLDERPRFTSDGDKTVIVPSAHYMGFLGSAEKYWVDLPEHNAELLLLRRNREHKDILEVDQLNNLIQSIISKTDIVFDTVLKNIEPIDDSNRLRLSIHSPVTLDAYDAEGNHTGKVCPSDSEFCYAEENILNSSYLEFGEGKYLNLPEDQMSKVKLQGTDFGTFTYESDKVLSDGTSTISSFIDIPVTTQTQAEITLNPSTQEPQIALDVTGDGISDFNLTPNANFDPILYLQIMKATIDSLDIPQSKLKAFDNRIDTIIKSIQKGKIDKAKLKAEKFAHIFKNTLSKSDPRKPKPHKLSKTDAQLLLDMLNKLLDNIS